MTTDCHIHRCRHNHVSEDLIDAGPLSTSHQKRQLQLDSPLLSVCNKRTKSFKTAGQSSLNLILFHSTSFEVSTQLTNLDPSTYYQSTTFTRNRKLQCTPYSLSYYWHQPWPCLTTSASTLPTHTLNSVTISVDIQTTPLGPALLRTLDASTWKWNLASVLWFRIGTQRAMQDLALRSQTGSILVRAQCGRMNNVRATVTPLNL